MLKKIHVLKEKSLLRHLSARDDTAPPFIVIDKKKFLNFCSNDYFNLSQHPSIKNAFSQGVALYGLGSTSSPQLTGYTKAHRQLEEIFAALIGREKALLFNSGYHANMGIFSVLANRSSRIFSDKQCHASLIDGIQLSRAKHIRYQHQNMSHLEALLNKNSNGLDNKNFIATESIFSMDGSISDIKALSLLAKKYHCKVIMDDAHGFGVLDTSSYKKMDCLITPLGKAVGSMGALVSGDAALIDALIQLSRTHRYSTALPPAICLATISALKLIETEHWRKHRLDSLISFFIREARKRNLVLISNDATPIKSIQLGTNLQALQVQQRLMQNGIYAACIRPPTVPEHTSRIRISLTVTHEEQHITSLLDTLQEAVCC